MPTVKSKSLTAILLVARRSQYACSKNCLFQTFNLLIELFKCTPIVDFAAPIFAFPGNIFELTFTIIGHVGY